MTAIDIYLKVVAAFDRLGWSYVTVGSFATNLYTDPRSTHDCDFVLELSRIDIARLMDELGRDEFKLETQMSFESVTMTSRYRISHPKGVFEIELFDLSTDPHDRERFARRVVRRVAGTDVWCLTAEDIIIITKLRWLVRAGRDKDRRDIRTSSPQELSNSISITFAAGRTNTGPGRCSNKC